MALKPDAYYGDVARNYDASRSPKEKWKNEIAAVDDFVSCGPVLDMPLGTGRFIPTYRAKGLQFTGADISPDMLAIAIQKYGDINAVICSAFAPPFNYGVFATAVCIRFIEWLPLNQAREIIKILASLSDNLIISINHGNEGKPDAYTYNYNKFLRILDALYIAGRSVTAQIPGITSEIFSLRTARWSDVLRQFHCETGAQENLQRLADKHAKFFSLSPIAMGDHMRVRAEYWDSARLREIKVRLDLAAGRTTEEFPRRTDGPMIVLERQGGDMLLLDGRRRINHTQDSVLPVLVIRE